MAAADGSIDVSKLTGLQLKLECSKRNLDLTGSIEELRARLENALRPPPPPPPVVVEVPIISSEPELRDLDKYITSDGTIIGLQEEEEARKKLEEDQVVKIEEGVVKIEEGVVVKIEEGVVKKEDNKEQGSEKKEPEKKKAVGALKFFNHTKGYGVIYGEGTLELFVHHSQVTGNLKALNKGVYVAYDSFVNRNDKHVAIRVELVDPKDEKKRFREQKGLKELLEADPDKIHSGTVRWFNIREGYGFIAPDAEGCSDLFLHQSEIYAERNYRVVSGGQKVEFKLALAPNGRIIAVSITAPGGGPIKLPQRGDYVPYEIKKDETDFETVKKEVLEELKKADMNLFPSINPHQDYIHHEPQPEQPLHPSDQYYSLYQRPLQRGKGPDMTATDDRPIVKGKVAQYSARKSFGFIKTETGEELFVHQSEIYADGYRLLIQDEDVEFRIGVNEKGKRFAAKVTGPGGALVKYVEPPEEKEFRAQLNKRKRESGGKKRKGKREKKDRGGTSATPQQEGEAKTETFYCAVCNLTLSGIPQLEAHNKGKKHIKLTAAATQNNGAIYRCLDCNKSFINRIDLKKHMEGKHQGAEAQEIVSTVPPSASPAIPQAQETRSTQTIEFVPQGTVPTGPLEKKDTIRPSGKNKKKKKKKKGGASKATTTTTTTTTPGTEGVAATPPVELECKICNAKFTGEAQKQQHMSGRKHKAKVAGEYLPPRGPFGYQGRKRKFPQGTGHMSAVPPPNYFVPASSYSDAGYSNQEPQKYNSYPQRGPHSPSKPIHQYQHYDPSQTPVSGYATSSYQTSYPQQQSSTSYPLSTSYSPTTSSYPPSTSAYPPPPTSSYPPPTSSYPPTSYPPTSYTPTSSYTYPEGSI